MAELLRKREVQMAAKWSSSEAVEFGVFDS